MTVLHLVRTSPFKQQDFAECLKTLGEHDTIVFLDDGCYSLHHSLSVKLSPSNQLYVIAEHAAARALTVLDTVKAISMTDLVTLTLASDKTITWQ